MAAKTLPLAYSERGNGASARIARYQRTFTDCPKWRWDGLPGDTCVCGKVEDAHRCLRKGKKS